MNKKYFENFFYYHSQGYRVSGIRIFYKNKLPYQALISFQFLDQKEKFISEYNDKCFPGYKYKIELVNSPESKDLQDINDIDTAAIVEFQIKYHEIISVNYEKSIKEEGLIFNDEKVSKEQSKVLSFLLKKVGSTLMKGESIMNISLPVTIFDKRTILQVLCYEHVFAPIILNRAFNCSTDIERLKWVTVFLISQMYLSPLQTKPFNPILGETYQLKIGDLDMYYEQVINKPPTCAFYGQAPNYKIFGNMAIEAKTGPNSIKATKTGKHILIFKDGHKFEFIQAPVGVKNINVGKRMFNYRRSSLVIDHKNSMASMITINPEKKTGITGLFSSSPKIFPDTFKGAIANLSDITIDKEFKHTFKKNYKPICSIEGEWTNFVKFGEQVYWVNGELDFPPFIKQLNTIESDSSKRVDLNYLLNDDIANSQKCKEEYEEVQRKDRELRAKFNPKEKEKKKK